MHVVVMHAIYVETCYSTAMSVFISYVLIVLCLPPISPVPWRSKHVGRRRGIDSELGQLGDPCGADH